MLVARPSRARRVQEWNDAPPSSRSMVEATNSRLGLRLGAWCTRISWASGPALAVSARAAHQRRSARSPPTAPRDDRGRRAVVAGQPHGRGAHEVLREPQEEADVGATEGVDRLVGVADRGRGSPSAPPAGAAAVLRRVDVLVLVDADPGPARPVLSTRAGSLASSLTGSRSRSVKSASPRSRSRCSNEPRASGSYAIPASSEAGRPVRSPVRSKSARNFLASLSEPVISRAISRRSVSSAMRKSAGRPARSCCSRRIRAPRLWMSRR